MKTVQALTQYFKDHDDFIIDEILVNNQTGYICCFNTLVDVNKTKLQIERITKVSQQTSLSNIKNNLGNKFDVTFEEIIKTLILGKVVILFDKGKQNVVIDPESQKLTRSISEPVTESNVQGALDAFIEDIQVNIGIVRKHLKSTQLFQRSFTLGAIQQKNISVLYIRDKANNRAIDKILEVLKDNSKTEIETLRDLASLFGHKRFDLLPTIYPTEMPSQTIHFLKKGRVVLFLDGFPFALIFPALFWDMFAVVSDHNYPFIIMVLIRLIRVLGAFITLVMPGLYVALVAVNPEVLRIQLALTIAQSREGIPYPATVEILIMLIVLELILEASVRLPKSIGPTITMVGGIIIGQAVVEAKLVSNLLIIILAATTIANSTIVGFQNSLVLRVFKYINVFLAAMFGILGILAGLSLMLIYLSSVTSFGTPYLFDESEGDKKMHV